MKSISTFGALITQLQRFPYLSVFLIALSLRWLLLLVGFEDYWGDAHHNLIISKLTLENGFVYSDFRDRHLTWLPLYRYMGSFIMWFTGTYSLLVLNFFNAIIGALAAILACFTGSKLLDKKTGLWIGLAVSIMPYLIVFSYISMAEMLGGFLLLAWFTSIYKEWMWLALICAFCAALTRYELTFLIGMSVLPLIFFKKYKAVGYTVIGLLLGLGIWSWWSYINSGNPLNWLLMRIESTTHSNSYYLDGSNRLKNNILIPITTLVQAFPLALLFIWLKKPVKKSSTDERVWFFLMGFLTLIHWLFFFVAQLKIITYPDPRFFILTLPITIIWFFSLYNRGYFRRFVTGKIIFVLLVLSLLQLVVPFYRQYSIQSRKEVGYWLKENTNEEQMIWSDLATAIVESEKDPRRFLSSIKIIPNAIRGTKDEAEYVAKMIEEKEIEYFTSYQAPYDYTSILWPEIKNLAPFEWGTFTFVPVFIYTPYETDVGIHGYLREQFESPNKPSSVWKIYKND